jgi:PhnB protein
VVFAGKQQEDGSMAITQITPYLNFDGDAAKAIELYQRVLGAKLEGNVQRFRDMPGAKPESKDRVMHAELRLGPNCALMLSDGPPGYPYTPEGNVHVSVQCDDPVDMGKKFDGLAEGGRVTMPLQDTFWGARFGMLTDPYGVRWMFNCPNKPA